MYYFLPKISNFSPPLRSCTKQGQSHLVPRCDAIWNDVNKCDMDFENDLIIPLSIWGSNQIRHKISAIAVSPDFTQFVTGSWDGNVIIWHLNNDGAQVDLCPRWIVSGQATSITAIACFRHYFVTCHQDGSCCLYDLPNGRHLRKVVDYNYIHTQAHPLGQTQVLCAGYYPDLVILDAESLNISVLVQSREQADWISCFHSFTRDNNIQVQGITTSGFLKTWNLSDVDNGVCLENSINPLGVRNTKAMSFHMKSRWSLLVTTSQVLVFDVGINIIFNHTTNEAVEGGDFFNDKILYWTKHGDVYECNVKTKQVKKIVKCKGTELHVPGNSLIHVNNKSYYVAADISGMISILSLEDSDPTLLTILTSADVSHSSRQGLFDYLGISIVSSIHIPNLNKFVTGCSDGKLLIFPATDLILSYFFNETQADFVCLSGHRGPVRCILYPHQEGSNFSDNILVSGGDDFSVCLWDIFKKELLHRFCVHGGPVVRLLTPPSDCNSRIVQAICSVSSDHSVAILSLRDRRCMFLASQHPFPIVAVRWKPCHDFLVVKCFDGSVFVWELGTGVLDRVVCGVAAEEVVYDCEQITEDILWDFYTAGPIADEVPRRPLHLVQTGPSCPVFLYGMLTKPHAEAFVLLINVSVLSSHLQAIFPNDVDATDVFKKIHFLAKPPDTSNSRIVDHLQDKFKLEGKRGKRKMMDRKVSSVSGTQVIPFAKLAISLLHRWGEVPTLDAECVQTLGLVKPSVFSSFDRASEFGSLSLQHPSFTKTGHDVMGRVALSALAQSLGFFSFSSSSGEDVAASWRRLISFTESSHLPVDLGCCQQLATLWPTPSIPVSKMVRKFFLKQLSSLDSPTCLQILGKWRNVLPNKDRDHIPSYLSTSAIVICSLLANDCNTVSKSFDIIKETAESIRYVITTRGLDSCLLATAIDMLGRGFNKWEEFFPVDEALLAIFLRCAECPESSVILTSRKTIRVIAKDRISQFIALLKFMCKTFHPALGQSKSEILSSLRELLIELPNGTLALLSDAVEVLLSCIDPGHLREAELSALLGIWLPQMHHNVSGQRIAVGMADGKVVVHDIRTRRAHVFQAHTDSVAAVRFSPDGKLLITLSASGAASLWQLSHGIFDIGVGQFRFKNIRIFPTTLDIPNFIKGINISWLDTKSITIETVQDKDIPSNTVTLTI